MRQWEYLRLSVCTWERRAKGWLDECLVILKNSFLSSGRGGKSNDRGGNRILLKARVTQSGGQVFTARKHQRVCTSYASDRWMTVRQGRVETWGNSLCASNTLFMSSSFSAVSCYRVCQLINGPVVDWLSYSSLCLCVVLYFVFVLIFFTTFVESRVDTLDTQYPSFVGCWRKRRVQ